MIKEDPQPGHNESRSTLQDYTLPAEYAAGLSYDQKAGYLGHGNQYFYIKDIEVFMCEWNKILVLID